MILIFPNYSFLGRLSDRVFLINPLAVPWISVNLHRVVLFWDQTRVVTHQVNLNFLTWPGGPLKYCYPLGSPAPNRSWLEDLKKVDHVLVSQETPELQAVKLFSFFKNYIFLFIYHIVIWKQCHLSTLLSFFTLNCS